MIRYQVIKLLKKRAGYSAVVVDNKHPSGVNGLAIRWFDTAEEAAAYCEKAKVAFEVIEEKVK